MPALRIKLPNSEQRTHVLRGTRVTVGRAPDNTIQISHPSISSHHAEFVSVDGRYQLHDLQSTNRSYVEGQPVTEQSLNDSCRILFGSVECEFDLAGPQPSSKPLALPPSPRPEAGADPAQLEVENCALRARLHALQRHFEILGSARLITGRSDLTPMAAVGDAVKSLSSERDELRQENVALRLQADRLREELAVTTRERDAARQAAESLQTERATLHAELKKAQTRIQQFETVVAAEAAPSAPPTQAGPPPLRPPASIPATPPPPPAGVVTRAPALPPPDSSLLPGLVSAFREALARCSANPAEVALHPLRDALSEILRNAGPLDVPSFVRLARATQSFLSGLVDARITPAAGPLRTLRHAGELLSRSLEPKLLAASRNLPVPRVLAIDDDADLLAAVTTAIQSVGLEATGCATGEDALALIEGNRFDTIIADLHLPQMNGAAFCANARELTTYRRTPILFLTVADTLDKRAETSLSGGNEFVAKPFNTLELTLKVECWALKHQLHLS